MSHNLKVFSILIVLNIPWPFYCTAARMRPYQEPIERPTFEGLVFRLEDFFHGEMQYTEASKVMGDDEDEENDES